MTLVELEDRVYEEFTKIGTNPISHDGAPLRKKLARKYTCPQVDIEIAYHHAFTRKREKQNDH